MQIYQFKHKFSTYFTWGVFAGSLFNFMFENL